MQTSTRNDTSHATKVVLDRAWQIAHEAAAGQQPTIICSAALLFALFDQARREALPYSLTLRFLATSLEGRWRAVAAQRAEFVSGNGRRELDARRGPLSLPARYIFRIAELLAQDGGYGQGMRLRHVLLALLMHPDAAVGSAAHEVLRRGGIEPSSMAMSFCQNIREETIWPRAPTV